MFALGLIVYFYVMVYLGVRKRKLSQIRQVSELVNAKHERRVAMTTALVTIAVILSFFPSFLAVYYKEFIQSFVNVWRCV